MVKTNLARLAAPPALTSWLTERTRDDLRAHSVTVDLDWWNSALAKRGFKATVVGTSPPTGGIVESGRAEISRGQLADMATGASRDAASALTLMWHSLAWGAGTSPRNMNRRLDSISAGGGDVASALVRAAQLSSQDPRGAYETLRPGGRNLVKFLGPAFFTKYLYFAGQGDADHPCAILDARVATSLHQNGWKSLHAGGAWPTYTYGRYVELLQRWAADAPAGRSVGIDEIEFWLFK